MTASFNYTADKRIPLSEAEYNLLADMLEKGDGEWPHSIEQYEPSLVGQ